MNSQTSLVAEQCRIQSWAMQIKDCQNRPKNMTVDEWCFQNNISSGTAAIIRGANGLCIELHENASADFLKKLIGAYTYAQ